MALQAKTVAGGAQEDSEKKETTKTVTGTASALPVPQVKELPPMPHQRMPLTSKTNEDLQQE